MVATGLDDLVLSHDRRGMTALRPYLPLEYCRRAAGLVHQNLERVLIATGFFVTRINAPETDGPPGALALGRAVTALGGQVVYVSDRFTTPLLNYYSVGADVIDFPICDAVESRAAAHLLLEQYRPSLLIAVERCGVTARGQYRNSRGEEISAYTARLDLLFDPAIPSLGIGDGGNEIGMGKLARVIPTIPGLPAEPCITATSELVIASTSNWGAYGVAAALSALAGRCLLPSPSAEEHLLRSLHDQGCYDGTCGEPTCGVDGFTLSENSALLGQLHNWLCEVGE